MDKIRQIAEGIDKLMITDIASRGCIEVLYKAAREKHDEPLSLGMAKILSEKVKPKNRVILTTGWMDQPEIAPGFGETDGPGGTMVLARALRQLCQAECIVVTDAELVDGMKKVAQAAGFHCVQPEMLDVSIEQGKLMTISIISFPVDRDEAKRQATVLLDEIKPACCISVERGGMNEDGCIHSMVGKDTSKNQAKVDYIFIEARCRGIATMAIGDGGNEIGMANIKDVIKEKIPHGDVCRCACGKGIAPSTEVDYLLTAAISNWGCFAVANMLCVLKADLSKLHDAQKEERILKNAADSGFHDAMYGGVEYSVDGCELSAHMSMATIMNQLVKQGLK